MGKQTIRNGLMSAGACLLWSWLEVPALLVFAPIAKRLTFTGDFELAFLMPIVLGIPSALVMATTGAITVWAVESDRPILWALPPAVVYAASSALAPHWGRPPETAALHAFVVVAALFPAAACLIGAAALNARLRHAKRVAE